MHLLLNAKDSGSPWTPEMICYKTKIFKRQFNPLLGVSVVSWQIVKSRVLSMGVTQLSPTLTLCTGRCYPHSLSVDLPHLPGIDVPFSGIKDQKSDGTGIIPLCNVVFRFVTGDGSGHIAGQSQTSPLHIWTMSKPQIINCKENNQKYFK